MLTPVTMYKCEFCGKVFKTSNRHNCKRDPAHKNCLTCKNQMGFDQHQSQLDFYGDYEISIIPNCQFKNTKEFEELYDSALAESNDDFIDVMWRKQWKLDCPAWEPKEVADARD